MGKLRKRIAIVGPVRSGGGVSSVANTVLDTQVIQKDYDVALFNTSMYEDASSLGNFIFFMRSVAAYAGSLAAGRIDLVHVHASYGRSFFRKAVFVLLSGAAGIKTVLHIHASRFREYFLRCRGLKKSLIGFILKRCDAVVLLSKNFEDGLRKEFLLRNTVVIRNPVPFALDQIAVDPGRRSATKVTILFLGFLVKSKGIHDLVEIARRLDHGAAPHRIVVCGKGDEGPFLEKVVRDERLTNLEYFGWASTPEKRDLLSKSGIFILPSYHEGMPVAILEALSYGLPIVSTKVGAIPELVIEGENGYLLEPGDIDGLVGKVTALISDPEKRAAFGARSRTIAESFSRESIALAWKTLYGEILSNP